MKNELICFHDPKSPIAEAFRMLRTNINFSKIDKRIESILVTSTNPTEGKTTITSNLAVCMAQTGKKILLIDTDLRNPQIHHNFDIENTLGVSNVISEDIEYTAVIEKIEGIDNLDIITAGSIPPNPAELLSSTRMDAFLEKVKNEYDMVLLDTPPVNSVTDAAILSNKVDGVIFVIQSAKTEIKVIKRAKEKLETVNAKILGVVLNKINAKITGYKYYHYNEDTKKPHKKRKKEELHND